MFYLYFSLFNKNIHEVKNIAIRIVSCHTYRDTYRIVKMCIVTSLPGGGAVGRPRVSVRDEMKMKPKKIWDLEFYAGNYAKLSRKCVGSFLTNLLVDLGMGPAKGMPDGVTPDGATTVPSSITTRDCRRTLLVQDQKSLHVFYDEIIWKRTQQSLYFCRLPHDSN